ncbi:MAG: ADP-glyceromanno-heptose 6-epimerase [Myxococcota bacterium]|jgi:ADP-L-glycero-D-manno-heptose 6-epimerase|nr:ADP-glyceromanno-heptose 6-epimerase [Myxococcota bacterium]
MSAPILVTGAAGFIGARFVESCAARGLDVVSVDRAAHFVERPEHAGVAFGRIVDRDALFAWLADGAPRLAGIVHLGACTDTTQLDVAYLERVNVDYSKRLWRFACERAVPFVYASSAATYGDGAHGYDDDESRVDALVPLNPYGDSKQRFDRFALAEAGRGAAPPVWSGFKFFNVYGFGERHKGRMASVVLHAFDQIRATGRVRLFRSHRGGIADGEQKRDFVAVEDVVDALHFALAMPLARGLYNLGTGSARTFLDLAHATFAALGRAPTIDFVDTPAELRARYQYFTEARMQKLRAAGWSHPATPLEAGVARSVARLLATAEPR